jgi:hypothetical protein
MGLYTWSRRGSEQPGTLRSLSSSSSFVKIAAAAAHCTVFHDGSSASLSLSQSLVSEEQKDLPVFVFQFALNCGSQCSLQSHGLRVKSLGVQCPASHWPGKTSFLATSTIMLSLIWVHNDQTHESDLESRNWHNLLNQQQPAARQQQQQPAAAAVALAHSQSCSATLSAIIINKNNIIITVTAAAAAAAAPPGRAAAALTLSLSLRVLPELCRTLPAD